MIDERPPLLITAMFRSGTALLTRILSADAGFRETFWEPLHPELPEQTQLYDHYRNYVNHSEILDHWKNRFHDTPLLLSTSDREESLRSYLSLIFQNNILAKTVRGQLRIGWILHHFPQLRVIHLVRDPRAVSYSYVKQGYQPTFWQMVKRYIPFLSNEIQPDSKRVSLDIYETKTYLNTLQNVDRWTSYLNNLKGSPPYITFLALWNILNKECQERLENGEISRWTTIQYENLCKRPVETLRNVYQLIDAEIPEMVRKNATGEAVNQMGGHKKWQTKISTKWMNEWKRRTDRTLWQRGVKKAQLEPTMKSFGYT